MLSVSNLGVIIQGPIHSKGRTMKDLQPREFDASENINQLFSRIKTLGASPLLVTWEDQDLSNLSNEVKDGYIRIKMPKFPLVFRLRNNVSGNNKYKQFYSVQKGVQYFEQKGIDYVLKIRTDQDFPIEVLLNYIESLNENDVGERIFTPLLNLDKPNMFYDFYYFSSTKIMLHFHYIMMNTKEICSNVHYDVFYRWKKRNEGIKVRDIQLIYPKYPLFTKQQLDLMNTAWLEDFSVFPRVCWREIIWRGEAFDESSVKPQFIFSEDNLDIRRIEILQKSHSSKFRIEVTPLLSFLISSRAEDHIRKLKIRARGALNRISRYRTMLIRRSENIG